MALNEPASTKVLMMMFFRGGVAKRHVPQSAPEYSTVDTLLYFHALHFEADRILRSYPSGNLDAVPPRQRLLRRVSKREVWWLPVSLRMREFKFSHAKI